MDADPRRPAPADLHLLPPGARARGGGRADAADAGRPHDAGDRARLPRPRGDARPAARAGQAEDPRGRHRLRGPAAATGSRTGSTPCCACSTWCSTRATTRRPARRSSGATCAPRRSGWRASSSSLLPDEPEALGLLALMLLTDARRPAREGADGELVLPRGPGPGPLGRAPDIAEGLGIVERALRKGRVGPYPAAGGHRRRPRRGAVGRGDRLAADPGPVRGAGQGRPVAGRRAQPCRRARPGGRAGRGAGRGRRAGRGPVDGRLPVLPRRPGRPARAAWAARRTPSSPTTGPLPSRRTTRSAAPARRRAEVAGRAVS